MTVELKSIDQIHKALQLDDVSHPLITLFDLSKFKLSDKAVGRKIVSSLYYISLKDSSCGLKYGRNTYDFGEGVMSFIAPGQTFEIINSGYQDAEGWMIFFHPDLIRNTSLGAKINTYKFFSYDTHEALHLSKAEEKTIESCINMITGEIKERIDQHSQSVIVSSLELLLNLSKRFYERQFNTRTTTNKGILSKVENLLNSYFDSEEVTQKGVPTVKYLANQVNLSANYLSDLLKTETGKTAKEHIDLCLIEKAKTILLSQSLSISQVAYDLGFEYPQHFSKLFKNRTGMSPSEFRNKN